MVHDGSQKLAASTHLRNISLSSIDIYRVIVPQFLQEGSYDADEPVHVCSWLLPTPD